VASTLVKSKNGFWKDVSVALAFAVQLVAIVWGLSSMNSKIGTLEEMKPVVTSVNERLIRVETQVEDLAGDLATHQSRTEARGGGDES